MTTNQQTEQWGIFELSLTGSAAGNPFLDVQFSAHFSYKHRTIEVDGFYDGDGVYRVRFMPDVQGEWRYVTHSNLAELNGKAGNFTCVAPSADNHLALCLCRWHPLQADRHDLLCLESARG